MDPITQQAVLAAAGAGGDKVYVDDVFSTTLYTGNNNSPSQVVNTGIDNTEKSMVWIKSRTTTFGHNLFDTVRGTGYRLSSNNSDGQVSDSSGVTAFNSNGITIGGSNYINGQNADIVAWNFKAAPGFFDVVTYTGNGTAGRTISHQLGSVPGMIIVKVTSGGTDDWFVYHRSLGDQRIKLNSTNASGSTAVWNYTAPTSSVFSVGTDGGVNGSGRTYVAYIFAHDDAQFGTDGDESIIKCGSYTGSGSPNKHIELGFEPQFVMFKNTTNSSDWFMMDIMRGFTVDGVKDHYIFANKTDAEADSPFINPTQTGFNFSSTGAGSNESGSTYIYMAIRRPNKPPETGADVFAIDTRGGTSPTPPTFNSGFPVDFSWRKDTTSSSWQARSRLTGVDRQLILDLNNAEYDNPTSTVTFDRMDGTGTNTGVDSANYSWMFKRAPGFFDIVAYTANNNTAFNVNHNLGVAPELIIIKDRDATRDWLVGSDALTAWGNYGLKLNTSDGENTSSNYFTAAPTSTQFKLGTSSDGNYGTNKFIAYLFATLPGISKVGSYSGTGSALNIDCGFTNGARFVLIKRTDSTGNWYLFDTVRGIVSGNDFAIALNSSSAQITGDYIDPLAAGFTINGSYAQWNESGGSYLFLAIA